MHHSFQQTKSTVVITEASLLEIVRRLLMLCKPATH